MNVLLGITGGIAAFKAASVVRLLAELGHNVKVLPTQNALRFIGTATLEALSHNSVDPDLYTDVDSVKHVKLGQEADLIIVAPASAAFLARLAGGFADDLLLNAILASKAPILVAPAMHTEMWFNPATQANVRTLRERGIFVLEPDSGRLTGSDSGQGRLPEPDAIVAAAMALKQSSGSLQTKRVLITAGGTREPIDAVRFIGNHSSGKQGMALAFAAQAAGASVTLIAANFEVSGLANVVKVETAAELQAAVTANLAQNDALIMAAAVSDFRVEKVSQQKIKRSEVGENFELSLIANPDILSEVAHSDYVGVTVGFAAETAGSIDRLATLAQIKLERKNCDAIVANDVTDSAVFGADHNTAYILDKSGASNLVSGSKLEVAAAVIDWLAKRLA